MTGNLTPQRDVRTRVPLSAAVLATAVALTAGLVSPAAPALASAGQTAPAGTITTVAGGVGGPGPATSVAMDTCGLGVSGGSLYVAAYSTVRRISTSTGALTTVVGNGAGTGGAIGGSALQYPLSGACGPGVDGSGNLLIASGSVLQIVAARTGKFYGQAMTAGHIYILAGQASNYRGDGTRPGDGGLAVKAALAQAVGVRTDRAGNIVITDSGIQQGCSDCFAIGAMIRVIAARTGTFYGKAMKAGHIYSVAGLPQLFPGAGNDGANDGGYATGAWLGTTVGAAALDSAGNIVIPDTGENDIGRTMAPTMRVVAVTTGTFYGRAMTAGHIYRIAGSYTYQGSFGNGGPAARSTLEEADGVAVDTAGNLVIADGNEVRVIAARTGTFYGQPMTAGDIYKLGTVQDDGFSANAMALDGAGNVVIGGRGYEQGDFVKVIAVKDGHFYGRAMTAGKLYTIGGTGSFYSGDGGAPARAEFAAPTGMTEDAPGDLAFADAENNTVWVVMASTGTFYGQNITAGRSYVIGGDGQEGYTGDGVPATKAAFWIPSETPSVTFDRAGNVVVADWGNQRVRVIAASTGTFYGQNMTAGYVYSIAGTGTSGFSGDGGPATSAELQDPGAVTTDRSGNLLVADWGNQRVRVIAASTGTFYGQKMTVGDIYTIAGDGNATYSGSGGLATQTGMAPFGLAVDAAGNVIIADGDNERVLVVAASTGTFYGQNMTAGHVYSIAGTGTSGFSGNGGPATSAVFARPAAVAVDNSGNVVMADEFNSVVWVIAAKSSTFYGQPMTAGHIYIVAGGGTALGSDGLGDGGPGTSARLAGPVGVLTDPAGDLLVADGGDNRIRSVSG
jgi:hypothetical protein